MTIESASYSVVINYISGRSSEVTFVVRKVSADTDEKGLNYIEFIPKGMGDAANAIGFVTEPDKILNNDPVFEIEMLKASEFVYYFKNPVPLDSIPKIRNMVAATSINAAPANGATGFAVFDSLGFSDSNKKIFFVEILIVFILLGTYLFYFHRSSGGSTILKNTAKPSQQAMPVIQAVPVDHLVPAAVNDAEKVAYIREVIKKAWIKLRHSRLDEAGLKYYEVKFLYELLDDMDKGLVFDEVIGFSDELVIRHINKMVDDGIIELAAGNDASASGLYEDINTEYSKLSDSQKEKVYPRCCELALYLRQNEKEK